MSLTRVKDLSAATKLTVDTNTLKVDETNNHVGFGTATPQAPIDATLAAGGDWVARFQNTTSGTPYGVQIYDAPSGANGYPLLQVTNSAGSGTYFRVDSGTGYVTKNNMPGFNISYNAVSGINATSSTQVLAGSTYYSASSLQQTGGSNFAFVKMLAISDVVVVFPCDPATTIFFVSEAICANISPLL